MVNFINTLLPTSEVFKTDKKLKKITNSFQWYEKKLLSIVTQSIQSFDNNRRQKKHQLRVMQWYTMDEKKQHESTLESGAFSASLEIVYESMR